MLSLDGCSADASNSSSATDHQKNINSKCSKVIEYTMSGAVIA